MMARIFFSGIGFFLLLACNRNQEVITPKTETITESVYASGIVKSKHQYQVSATINGLLEEVFVTEGQMVTMGQPLFKIKNTTVQLNTENAKLAAAFASPNNNVDKLNELKINAEVAKSKMLNDSVMWQRQKNLWQQNIGSKAELELKELNYKNSFSTYKTILLRYDDLKKQIDFNAQQANKNVAISQSLTNDYIIKSETTGKVFSLLKEKGELITPQTVLAVIGSADAFYIELQVDEYDIAKMKMGQKVILSLDSYKGKTFEATISKIIPIMNERSRSFTVEANFISQPETLFPNLNVEANILLQTKNRALTIPRNYLVKDSFVLLENEQLQKVVIGLKDYQKAEILSGIDANTKIVKPAK